MRKLILLSLLISSAFSLKAQYTFKVLSNGNPYESCETALLTYEFTYTGSNKPESVFITENGKRIIRTDDWSIIGNKYQLSRFLIKGTYNPIIYIYKGGVLTRLVLPQAIKVYSNPKAAFSLETDTISCESNVVLCLKDKAETGTDNNALEKIEIDWGNGKTTEGTVAGTACMTYVTNGLKDITYTVIDKKGCFSTLGIKDYFNVKNELPLALHYNNLALDSAKQLSSLTIKLNTTKSADSLVEIKTDITQLVNAIGTNDGIIESKTFKLGNDGFIDTTLGLLFNLPAGKYEVTTVAKNAAGCTGSVSKKIIIGHLASSSFKSACNGEATTFTDSVYYWNKKGQEYCKLVNWTENGSCIDTNSFFYRPDSVRKKLYGKFQSYTPPTHKERIAWDFEDDGVIDLWDVHNPSYTYPSGGTFNCAMWTMDSIGVWQKSLNEIVVNDHDFIIELANPNTKICLPQRIQFKVYDKKNNFKLDTLYLNNKPIANIHGENFLYMENIIEEFNYSILTKDGCFLDNIKAPKMKLIGAKTDFEILSDTFLCAGDALEYTNKSDSGKYDWTVTEYSRKNTNNERNYYINNQKDLSYDNLYPGLWQAMLTTTINYYDSDLNRTLTCRTSKKTEFRHDVRRGFKTDFEIDTLLGKATVRFLSIDSIANNVEYFYSINDGKKVKIDTFEGSYRKFKTFTIQFPTTEKYKVCFYGYRDACADSTCKTFWINSVGLNENHLSKIELYPNPTSENSNLTFPFESGNYKIIDFTGRTLTQGNLVEGINEISIANLPKGIYLIEISQEKHILQKRLIKN